MESKKYSNVFGKTRATTRAGALEQRDADEAVVPEEPADDEGGPCTQFAIVET